jgi:serine protease Do
MISALLAATVLAGCSSNVDEVRTGVIAPGPMAAVVKIFASKADGKGHGSGVHIGGGIVVTAAHVIDGATIDRVLMESGAEEAASVLWSNKEYDIALLRMGADAAVVLPSAKIDCREPRVGEEITARGNPGQMEFVEVRGHIAGKARAFDGFWRVALPADISFIGGISGGPVYDSDGDVVGVAVGAALAPTATGNDASATGYAMIVPASVVCMLMGRA